MCAHFILRAIIYIYIYTHYVYNYIIFNHRVSVHYAGLLVAYSFPWGSLGHPRQAARAKANEEKPGPTELQVSQISALVIDFMGFHGILMGFRQEHLLFFEEIYQWGDPMASELV